MFRKILVLFFSLLLVVTAVACSDPSEPPANVSGSETQADSAAPPPVINYDGMDFLVYGEEAILEAFFYEEEQKDDLVSAAKYTVISNIEERYNINIGIYDTGLNGGNHVGQVTAMIDSGETDYSLYETHDVLGTAAAMNGYFMNLKKVPNIDTSKPWWRNADDLTINNRLYMISTDMAYTDVALTWCIFFNKQIMDDFQIAYPFEDVLNGSWTLDKMIAITKDVYVDFNSNNKVDSEDVFGFCDAPNMYAWMEAMDCPMTVIGSDGRLTITDQETKAVEICSTLYNWMTGTVGARSTGIENDFNHNAFKNGKYMIVEGTLNLAATALRDLEDFEYGILPIPKYDERQETNKTVSASYPFWIPNCLGEEQTASTGLIVEALSCEGYNILIPAFYDKALKNKFSPSDMDSKMIQTVYDSRHPDLVRFHDYMNNTWGMDRIITEMFLSNNPNVTSYIASKRESTTGLLELYNLAYGF